MGKIAGKNVFFSFLRAFHLEAVQAASTKHNTSTQGPKSRSTNQKRSIYSRKSRLRRKRTAFSRFIKLRVKHFAPSPSVTIESQLCDFDYPCEKNGFEYLLEHPERKSNTNQEKAFFTPYYTEQTHRNQHNPHEKAFFTVSSRNKTPRNTRSTAKDSTLYILFNFGQEHRLRAKLVKHAVVTRLTPQRQTLSTFRSEKNRVKSDGQSSKPACLHSKRIYWFARGHRLPIVGINGDCERGWNLVSPVA